MINRVLIRIKVVQLLYSTFLTETRFMLESSPSAPTKEKRFAYNLYLSNLVLFCKIAENIKKHFKGGGLLEETRLIKKLRREDEIKAFQTQNFPKEFMESGLVDHFSEIISSSVLYKDFVKNYPEDDGDKIWEKIFNAIIVNDPLYNSVVSRIPNYSLGAIDRMKDMMAKTFRNFYVTQDNIEESLAVLRKSMDRARELYLRLMTLPCDITFLRKQQLDENLHKYLVSQEDLHPNTKFVDNRLVELLNENPTLAEFSEKNSWLKEDRNMVRILLKEIMESDVYARYMETPQSDLKEDIDFWRDIYKYVIFDSENFLDALESQSVFWNDDLGTIGTFVLKSFKKFDEPDEDNEKVLPMYRNDQDAKFGAELFSYVVKNKDYYRTLIDEALEEDKWEIDRLAFMDVIIIMTAMAEIINYPEIPLAATYNEYIEIAKSYSTSKSGTFVNGILHSIVLKLREEGKIYK